MADIPIATDDFHRADAPTLGTNWEVFPRAYDVPAPIEQRCRIVSSEAIGPLNIQAFIPPEIFTAVSILQHTEIYAQVRSRLFRPPSVDTLDSNQISVYIRGYKVRPRYDETRIVVKFYSFSINKDLLGGQWGSIDKYWRDDVGWWTTGLLTVGGLSLGDVNTVRIEIKENGPLIIRGIVNGAVIGSVSDNEFGYGNSVFPGFYYGGLFIVGRYDPSTQPSPVVVTNFEEGLLTTREPPEPGGRLTSPTKALMFNNIAMQGCYGMQQGVMMQTIVNETNIGYERRMNKSRGYVPGTGFLTIPRRRWILTVPNLQTEPGVAGSVANKTYRQLRNFFTDVGRHEAFWFWDPEENPNPSGIDDAKGRYAVRFDDIKITFTMTGYCSMSASIPVIQVAGN